MGARLPMAKVQRVEARRSDAAIVCAGEQTATISEMEIIDGEGHHAGQLASAGVHLPACHPHVFNMAKF